MVKDGFEDTVELHAEDAEDAKLRIGSGLPTTPYAVQRLTTMLDPAALERLKLDDPPRHCLQSGVCCTRIMLSQSPREMREAYNNWVREYKQNGAVSIQMGATANKEKYAPKLYGEIELIYPMLVGRCLGKMWLSWTGDEGVKQMHRVPKPGPERQRVLGATEHADLQSSYVYGPCKHLGWKQSDNKVVGVCTIHAIRPGMCRNYPYYGSDENYDAGMWKGCGYNRDADYGLSAKDFIQPLDPLEDNEL